MITRYDIFYNCNCDSECSCGKHIYDDGEFVTYDDHKAEVDGLNRKLAITMDILKDISCGGLSAEIMAYEALIKLKDM